MSDLDTRIEETLRGLQRPLKTSALAALLAGPAYGIDEPGVYKRLLALAPRCPAAHKDKDHGFTRYGRTCYPWVWHPLPPGQPLQAAASAVIKLEDGAEERIAQRVVALLLERDHLTLATVGPVAPRDDLEECLLCSQPFPSHLLTDGICQDCMEKEV